MKAQDCVKLNNTIIFNADEYRNGNIEQFDGHVQSINEKGVDVLYLSRCKSRNGFITWENVIAKLDKRKPYISLKKAPYKGFFIEFNQQP